MQRKVISALGLFVIINYLIILFFRGNVTDVVDLYDKISVSAPYFVPEYFGTLYIIVPLVLFSSVVVLLMPGIMIVLASGKQLHAGEILLKGFGLSFLLMFFSTSLIKLSGDVVLSSESFLINLAVVLCLSFAYFVVKIRSSEVTAWLFSDADSRRQLICSFIIVIVATVALLPIIFWQDINDDGFEALEIGRSLATQIMPSFTNVSGNMGLGIGMLTMAYPVHWFIMLFGPIEAAARMPMLIYLVVIFSGLVAMIEYDSRRKLFKTELFVLMLGLATYVTAMGFNSGYDPYFTDISSPTAFETLTVLLMIGAAYFLYTGQRTWFFLFALMGFLARPTTLLFVLMLGIGMFLAMKEKPRREYLYPIGISILVWVALLLGYEHLYLASVSEAPIGYPSSSIISRFKYIRFDDLQRFLYAAAAGGFIPVFSLLLYKWQDSLSRTITIVTIGYFTTFYFPAFIALHHYVPAMILPMIVLWRLVVSTANNIRSAIIIGLISVLSIWLSLPNHFEINRVFREIGKKVDYRIGDYNGSYQQHRKAIVKASLLSNIFLSGWDVEDPYKELVGGSQLLYYASLDKVANQEINYIVDNKILPKPVGFETVLEDHKRGGAVYIKDIDIWKASRFSPPTKNYRSFLYDIPRIDLFPFEGIPAKNYNLSMLSVPLLWRLFK